ncbi:MAG: nucleotidyltransferase domain-containing protein [Opitutaceae bacterium]|nr:nucleotidyltransferase domain-containing protein [Opitutaceae bacterium]
MMEPRISTFADAEALREAVAAVEERLAGRPATAMSHEEQHHLSRLAASYLHTRGAVRVWWFGSLARGRPAGVHTDFDFAVEGLPAAAFFGSLGTLLQVMPLPVDLVEVETAPPALRARIFREGIPLQE